MDTIHTYKELTDVYMAWFDQHSWGPTTKKNHKLILGRPGTGKSQILLNLLKSQRMEEGVDYLRFGGNGSQSQMYTNMVAAPDLPMIFDDIDTILSDRKQATMMREASERRSPRPVHHNVKRPPSDPTPSVIYMTGPVVILMNEIPNPKSGIQKSLLSRLDGIEFNPTNKELFNYWQTWAKDPELVVFVKNLFPCLPEGTLNLRTLENFEEWYNSPRYNVVDKVTGWLKGLLPPDEMALAAMIANNQSKKKLREHWAAMTGKTQVAADRQVSRLLKSGLVEKVADALRQLCE